MPLFESVQLKSSKYFQFLIFKKAVILIKYKKHLCRSAHEGKLELIGYYNEMKLSNLSAPPYRPVRETQHQDNKNIIITDY